MQKHAKTVLLLSLAIGVLATACDGTTDDEGAAEELIATFGGKLEKSSFSSFRYTALGSTAVGDEGIAPGMSLATSDYERVISYDARREALRIDHSSTLRFELLDGAPQEFSEVIIGDAGAVTAGESVLGTPARSLPSDRVASTWRRTELLNPLLLILRARPGAIRRGPRIEIDGELHRTFILDQGQTELMFVVSRRSRLVQVRTQESHRLHRDVPLVVEYSDWRRLPGSLLRAPMAVRMTINEIVVLDETRRDAEARPDFPDGTFDIGVDVDETPFSEDDYEIGRLGHHWNQAWSALGIPLEPIVRTMTPQPITDGVFLVTGGVHNTLVVAQETGVVVVDGPVGPEQGKGIAEFIAEAFPGKPISHVIPSHFHQDHTASVRELAGAGAEVLVPSAMKAYWTDLLARSSKLIPDRQERDGAATVHGFDGDRFELLDPQRPMSILHIPDNAHASDMVLVTVDTDAARYVFVADLYGPFGGSFIVGGPEDFLRGLQQHGLIDASCQTDSPLLVVGAHGGVEPIADSLTFIESLGIDLSEICQ